MELWDAFLEYDKLHPAQHAEVKQLCTALRRSGINTIESMMDIYNSIPEKLLSIRGIGPLRMKLIKNILQFYEAKAPPGEPPKQIEKLAQGAPCISRYSANNESLSETKKNESVAFY